MLLYIDPHTIYAILHLSSTSWQSNQNAFFFFPPKINVQHLMNISCNVVITALKLFLRTLIGHIFIIEFLAF